MKKVFKVILIGVGWLFLLCLALALIAFIDNGWIILTTSGVCYLVGSLRGFSEGIEIGRYNEWLRH